MPAHLAHKKRLGSPALRWGVFLLLWVCFIWGHSLIQGPQSSAESGFVYALLRPLFEALGVVDRDLCTFIIRKCAHFSEYAMLGIISINFGRALVGEKRLSPRLRALPTLLCALVPAADETLQLFVPGRSGSPRDVLIDLCGMATGALLAVAWKALRARRPQGR